MSKRTGYIDHGDRIIVVGNTHAVGSSNLSAHQGRHGTVLNNDGFGLCQIRLDNRTIVYAWSDVDIKRE
mgnify:CR=1 FL=1